MNIMMAKILLRTSRAMKASHNSVLNAAHFLLALLFRALYKLS